MPGPVSFPELEKDILARWKTERIFEKTLERTKKGKRFVFFEGPPTANGRPHIGHVLARAYKDVICRFKTMQGFFVERKAGWDTQGLPVELEVEKQLKVSGKKDIEKYGIEKFNQACRESVWKYKAEWEKMTERIGYWLDLERPYITYKSTYIESLWWIFKQLWEKKLLVKDFKVVPQCPHCETTLSSHEVAQGYERVTEKAVFVKFKVKSEKGKVKKGDYILSWTTTPWTLPGNVALAVNAKERYGITNPNKNGNRFVIVLSRPDRLVGGEAVLKQEKDGAILGFQEELSGAELVGVEYEPLFPNAIPRTTEGHENAFRVFAADFVTTDDGTGIVHTAVMYGEDDYNLGQKVGLPKQHTVNPDGTFNEFVPKWAGKFVKDVEPDIVKDLDERGLLYRTEEYTHDYPFCWRCHTPLLYYAKDSWFIKMSALREKLIANNGRINWVPEYIKHGRFGEWLNEIKDWAISRERYWGTPLPIWVCEKDQSHLVCIGSFKELAEKSSNEKTLAESFDPHRPFIDDVSFPCECGGTMKRIPEVADAWFDSGAMPFAQWHYPFENKERIDDGVNFPADYIAEAIDQTRGWFYTLLAVSTALGKEVPPYKNVICLGHVLDAKGRKMSKHIGNVVDPWTMFEKYGADAVRFYFYSVNQPGDVKLFDEKSVDGVVKKFFMILWNVVSFWEMYRSPEPPKPIEPGKRPLLDRWVLTELAILVDSITVYLDSYDVTSASRIISDFVTDLSTWYVRRSRERFKQAGADRDAAEQTLHQCLSVLARVMAPFAPMVADALWLRLGQPGSVHLADWPKALWRSEQPAAVRDQMKRVFQLVELGHALRAEAGIRVRQPLDQFVVVGLDVESDFEDLIKAELNVREVVEAKSLPTSDGWRSKTAGNVHVALDCTITDELREAGLVRELARHINDTRKTLGLQPKDLIRVAIQSDDPFLQGLVERYGDELKKAVNARTLKSAAAVENGKTIELDGKPLAFRIERKP